MGEELSAAHAELAEIGIVLLMRLAECAENALDLGDVRFESLAVILDDHAFPIQGDQQPGCVCIDGIHGRFEAGLGEARGLPRSEEHTSELQSLMRISYAVFCLKKQITQQ